jgi:Zn-finger protein
MSIVICDDCGTRIDLDAEEAYDVYDDGSVWLCEDCSWIRKQEGGV